MDFGRLEIDLRESHKECGGSETAQGWCPGEKDNGEPDDSRYNGDHGQNARHSPECRGDTFTALKAKPDWKTMASSCGKSCHHGGFSIGVVSRDESWNERFRYIDDQGDETPFLAKGSGDI